MTKFYFIFLIFRKSKQLNKFEGADFKCDNSFFKFKPKRNKFPARKYPNEAFFVLNVSIFYFCMKLRETLSETLSELNFI